MPLPPRSIPTPNPATPATPESPHPRCGVAECKSRCPFLRCPSQELLCCAPPYAPSLSHYKLKEYTAARRRALHDFSRYCSDVIPPLLVWPSYGHFFGVRRICGMLSVHKL